MAIPPGISIQGRDTDLASNKINAGDKIYFKAKV